MCTLLQKQYLLWDMRTQFEDFDVAFHNPQRQIQRHSITTDTNRWQIKWKPKTNASY